MKRVLGVGGLLFFIVSCYADGNSDPCANNNAYLRQACETLQQSSQSSAKERNEAYEKEMEKSRKATRKLIESEEAPPTPPPAPPQAPWQEALKPTPPPQNQNNAIAETQPESPNTEVKIAPLPAPGATKFSTPAPVTLPGGVSIVPTKPSKSNSIPYY